jgi:hypothetical protein
MIHTAHTAEIVGEAIIILQLITNNHHDFTVFFGTSLTFDATKCLRCDNYLKMLTLHN